MAYLGSGATGVLFSATGPVAVIMGASSAGGLTAAQTASWIMGVFGLNGALTLVTSWVYRTPLAFFWTIPGTVLVGQALPHQQWSDVVGAYVVTGVLIVVLGVTALVPRLMKALPNAVVMAMVAGAFLTFGTSMVQAVSTDVAVAGTIVVTWLVVTANPGLASRVPAAMASLVTGTAVLFSTNGFEEASGGAAELSWLGVPELVVPTWNWSTCVELVIPLAVTVLVVQNGQGAAILRAAGHRPPMTVTTVLCGVWSVLAAPMGAVSTCLAGPTNALLVVEGRRERQYIAAWCAAPWRWWWASLRRSWSVRSRWFPQPSSRHSRRPATAPPQ